MSNVSGHGPRSTGVSYLAVIDLGTNTFHLLIVSSDNTTLHRERIFVNLAGEGIGKIGPAAYDRGLQAIKTFHEILKRYPGVRVRAIGTAALRNAINADVFIREIYQHTGIRIEVIDGKQEASFIAKGVRSALGRTVPDALVMDIGGGSVEFVICRQETVTFSASYELGVAILYHGFHHSDPISAQEISAIYAHLRVELRDLLEALSKRDTPLTLVGASGTFEVLDTIFAGNLVTQPYSRLDVAEFYTFFDNMLTTTLAERLEMPEIPNSRAEYFIVALLLIRFVLDHLGTDRYIAVSSALKEGVLLEMRNI